jgi:hypothetical protein
MKTAATEVSRTVRRLAIAAATAQVERDGLEFGHPFTNHFSQLYRAAMDEAIELGLFDEVVALGRTLLESFRAAEVSA